MNESQSNLFHGSELDAATGIDASTWLLSMLEVYNWGPFAGYHAAEFDAAGTAIIGPTGSGKTTLVDALMTLLVANPRYNLASTGGHESDRTLISYVRGVLGGDGSDGGEEVSRTGKTITGVCATYQAGKETLRLAGLMWIDGNGTSLKDLKRRWIFSQADGQDFQGWLRLLHDGGARELVRTGKETAGLRVFADSKKSFLAHTRKFFDVGENAFTLLNRAAGLKQLNSIDEIFRELVLDDRSAFDRALEVAAEFDNLAGIHAELETARRQQQALEPVAAEHRKLTKAVEKMESLQAVHRLLPRWFATQSKELWQRSLTEIEDQRQQKSTRRNELQREVDSKKSQVDTLYQKYMTLGGDAIGDLEKTIGLLQDRVVERTKHAEQYLNAIRALQLDESLTESALRQNKIALAEMRPAMQQQQETAERQTLDANSELRGAEKEIAEVAQQLEKVRQRPSSNIPPRFHDFRFELATELSLDETELPFLAELVEVKPSDANWRGAIERAIGSERLRILVPEPQVKSALRWINSRNNRLHVRLQAVSSTITPRSFFADGFTQKLNFKDHALIGAAKDLLAQRDRHCVDSAAALQTIEHGMTIEGTMSGRRGKFEKQDQRHLNEGWMTGFDNKAQLQSLQQQLAERSASAKTLKVTYEKSLAQQKSIEQQLAFIDRLATTEFSNIDLHQARSELKDSASRRDALLDPNSDASRAKIDFEAANDELEKLQVSVQNMGNEIAVLNHQAAEAKDELQKSVSRIGEGLSENEDSLARSQLAIPEGTSAKQMVDLERVEAARLGEQLEQQSTRVADHERQLVRLMGKAKAVDTGALLEVGEDLPDVADYIERLRVLNKEALPKKRKRFLQYLNESSDQGVTQLLAGVREEVDLIEHRIDELNQTLLKVDFRSGRYLQLLPQRIKHERLRTLETSQRKLRSAALKDDEGESHYKALRVLVTILRDAAENRKQKGSLALLDPRYRLEFYVVEVDRKTGKQSPRRSGSQSGSGGEKELMASHILTASLSYALCPTAAKRPLYGTVVLDEAFSKSSRSAATRIVEALRIFGLHPIFVTPNKEISLLKQHTRRVICVQRPGKRSSLTSISWEKLEGLARSR